MKCDYSDVRALKAHFKGVFLEGAGSIMSLQGDYFSLPIISQESDAESIRQDWECVGNDLKYAMQKVR